MKIHLLQYQVSFEPEKNMHEIERAFVLAKEADLIVAPEACTTGFQYQNLATLAKENRKHIDTISQLCLRHAKAFIGSLFYEENGQIYNRAFFIGPDGKTLTHYDKIRLIPAFREDQYLTPGEKTVVANFKSWSVGLAICYDLRFPEIFRELALREADLMVVCAEWPASRVEHMVALAKARAIENQCYFVLVNATGKTGKIEMAGRSMAISPRGEVLIDLETACAGETVQLQKEEIDNYRSAFPALYQFSRSSQSGGSDQ